MEERYTQPWQIVDGDRIVFEGTRSECMSEKAQLNSGYELRKNPEFWDKED